MSDQYVTREEKSARVTELKTAIARQAVEYPGVLPADAQATWDADTAELETLERDIKAWDERQARLAAYAQDENKVEKPVVVNRLRPERTHVPEDIYAIGSYRNLSNSDDQLSMALRDGARKALDRIVFAHPEVRQDAAKEGVERLLAGDREGAFAKQVLATDSPIYRRAFEKYAVFGPNASFTQEERVALAMGVTTTGGFLVEAAMDPTLIPEGAWTSINAVRATARVEKITNTNVWHGLTATAVTATRDTEAAATTEQAPTLAQPAIQPTKVQGQITFSIETGEDRPNLATELAILIQEAKDTEEEAIFTVGVGDALGTATNPIGVLAAHGTAGAYAHVATAADGTLAIADIDTVFATLALRHRQRAIWLMSRSVLGAIQGFETVGGRLFGSQAGYPAVGQVGTTPSTGDTGLRLLGRPVYEAPSGLSVADAANKILLCLYDPSTYCIVDRVGLSVEYIPFIFGAAQGNLVTGQRGLYFHWRNSAKPLFTTGGLQLAHQA